MIFGKSSSESPNYDTIVFCNRDAKTITIPKYIKHIGSHSFGRCNRLRQVDIPSDSELQTICDHSFFKSSIESIMIPKHVTRIEESAFSHCSQLETIKIQQDSELEMIDKYAFSNSSIKSFFIPPHLKQINEKTFLNCNQLKEIEIPADSELKTIEEKAFSNSSIESFTIPKSLIDLKDGWCEGASKLMSVDVDPNNPRYSKFDDKMIFGKSSSESPNYDTIVFCNRDAKTITIPKYIKHIGSHSFGRCNRLRQVDIPSDSELQTICDHSFFKSSIESIMIPNQVTIIDKYAFSECEQLRAVEISVDSELKKIGKNAFCESSIESLLIPKSLINLDMKWCIGTPNLMRIDVDPNNPRYSNYGGQMIVGKSTIDAPNFDTLIFCNRDVKSITIPNFIKCIGQFAFENCHHLQTVEVKAESELQRIDKLAFYNSSIETFMIPKSLNDLIYGWCAGLYMLKNVDVDPNNPRYLKYDDNIIIGKSTFEAQSYDTVVFCNRYAKTIAIPKFIKHIGHYSFDYCMNLTKIEFPIDSELQTINCFAFNDSGIERFTVPPHVTFIGRYAFSHCQSLHRINFSADSELTTIEEYAFSDSSIESFLIPCHVKQIGKSTFSNCDNLQIIEIDENSEIEKFDQHSFDCKNAIII